MPTPCALVTGASAGIGEAFARELARRGHTLALTARRGERLQHLAASLHQSFGTRVEVLVADLADPQAPRALCSMLEQRGLRVEILVNNAGYGVPGTFEQAPWRAHEDFLQVMVRAPTELTHRLLPAMREAGHGRIVNVASLAAHLPGSVGHTLYAAAKAYLLRFSQSLALENEGSGVRVCALCPGFTYSEFHDVTGARELVSRLPRWLWMDADTVARQGLDAVERGDAVYVNGAVNRLIKACSDLLPSRAALALARRHSHRYRRTG